MSLTSLFKNFGNSQTCQSGDNIIDSLWKNPHHLLITFSIQKFYSGVRVVDWEITLVVQHDRESKKKPRKPVQVVRRSEYAFISQTTPKFGFFYSPFLNKLHWKNYFCYLVVNNSGHRFWLAWKLQLTTVVSASVPTVVMKKTVAVLALVLSVHEQN